MKKEKQINHKFIGYHNQEPVVSTYGFDKDDAELKCRELLLEYFHNKSKGCTLFPLEYYNGVVAYVGQSSIEYTHPNIVEYKYSKYYS